MNYPPPHQKKKKKLGRSCDKEQFAAKLCKNDPYDVMKGEVEKKTPKKEMDNPSFF